MSLGPFLKRELATSARGSRAFVDRGHAANLTAIVIGACFWFWDYWGWDRASVVGGRRFGLTIFGLMVVVVAILESSTIITQVAASIASERDRKTLDALLASRFSAAEIVLGAMAAGLFRFANAASALIPIVVLMMFLGGVEPSWVALAVVGLASTAVLMASVSVAASVGARTGVRALSVAVGIYGLWIGLPPIYLILRPIVWPGAPDWLTSAVLTMADAGPIGLLMNLSGIFPRPGGPIEAVLRMVGWQSLGSLAMVAWAILRLRPASRGLYDVAGEATRLKILRATRRRLPQRPPCGDDPVLWREILAARAANRAAGLLAVGGVVLGILWFAKAAFAELFERGYGPSPEGFSMPEINPFARMLVSKLSGTLTMEARPGQARLEFNIALRVFTGLFATSYAIMAVSAVGDSMKNERTRDTWLGLIATPLTGAEILRGKMLGSLWRVRDVVYALVGLWTVGLLAGAVHPLGYLAAVAFLVISGPFHAASGLALALVESDPSRGSFDSRSLIQVPVFLAAIVVLGLGPPALAWASLLTYEDVDALICSGPFPELGPTPLKDVLGARTVAALWLAGTAAMAFGAVRQIRANARNFDAAVGRPVRPGSPSA